MKIEILKSILLITLGLFGIIYIYKKPSKTLPAHNLLGFLGGILIIILGCLSLFGIIALS